MNIASMLLAQIEKRSNCSERELANPDKICASVLPQVSASQGTVQSVLAIVFAVFGAAAVILIIVASINMAAADGNPEKISQSKRAIIYAAVGLTIAVSAEIIVFTLLGKLGG